MSNFATEVVAKIEEIKKSTQAGTALTQDDLEVLFLASLLEEEGHGNS
ncbi:hypothetical protein [Halobacteriovorax sp. JY17]|nr:hypothetical protein [Halobacteriovorax sp. JY17]